MANLSLLYGNSDLSSLAYSCYAFVAGGLTGNYPLAYQLGRVALQLSEKYSNQSIQCKVNYIFGCGTNPWNRDLRSSAEYLEKSFNILFHIPPKYILLKFFNYDQI